MKSPGGGGGGIAGLTSNASLVLLVGKTPPTATTPEVTIMSVVFSPGGWGASFPSNGCLCHFPVLVFKKNSWNQNIDMKIKKKNSWNQNIEMKILKKLVKSPGIEISSF